MLYWATPWVEFRGIEHLDVPPSHVVGAPPLSYHANEWQLNSLIKSCTHNEMKRCCVAVNSGRYFGLPRPTNDRSVTVTMAEWLRDMCWAPIVRQLIHPSRDLWPSKSSAKPQKMEAERGAFGHSVVHFIEILHSNVFSYDKNIKQSL